MFIKIKKKTKTFVFTDVNFETITGFAMIINNNRVANIFTEKALTIENIIIVLCSYIIIIIELFNFTFNMLTYSLSILKSL